MDSDHARETEEKIGERAARTGETITDAVDRARRPARKRIPASDAAESMGRGLRH